MYLDERLDGNGGSGGGIGFDVSCDDGGDAATVLLLLLLLVVSSRFDDVLLALLFVSTRCSFYAMKIYLYTGVNLLSLVFYSH